MTKLTSRQAYDLANNFLGLAQAIGDFRYNNWYLLSKDDNQKLGDLQWSILNSGEDILALSTILVMDDVSESLEKINGITAMIKGNIHTLQNIQKGINIAASIVTLGAAIISKNARSVTEAIDGLAKELEA
jgi:cell division protein ZapA (FtsZ GTPase activity inhibitor)